MTVGNPWQFQLKEEFHPSINKSSIYKNIVTNINSPILRGGNVKRGHISLLLIGDGRE